MRHRDLDRGEAFRARLCELARQYDLVALYAFGSRAVEVAARVAGEPREPTSPASDVDIGVLPKRGRRLTAQERVRLMVALEDLLDVDRVDLVVLPEASPYLALDIVCGELLCATDPDAEAEYQLYVLRQAGDLAPWERERRRMLLTGEAI
ncbi:MAG: nucleotidyltransferase domain-containing protein [Chloroflexi bacterium]|nr:MAG: nucleotidyltransferase domain-containing protein [Chloroflexota bacterium]